MRCKQTRATGQSPSVNPVHNPFNQSTDTSSPTTVMTDQKIYINAQDLLLDSFQLGAQILLSGFRPNFIIGVWRGGTPVGIAVQEIMDYFDVKTDHIAIRTSSYTGIGQRSKQVQVHGLGYIVRTINAEDALLIVDDVFDTGSSIEAIITELQLRTRKNTPHEIRVATPWYKPTNNKTDREPDYYIHSTDRWLVFPHELHGLDDTEIHENKAGLRPIFDQVRAATAK